MQKANWSWYTYSITVLNVFFMTKADFPNFIQIQKVVIGKGLVTSKPIRSQTVIFPLLGTILHHSLISAIGGTFLDNTIRFGPETYLNPAGQLGDFLNHSCRPNAKIIKQKNKLFIVSLRNIPKGTEITIDYSTILGRDDTWEMRCRCGSSQCRKVIKQFGTLPQPILKKYKKLEAIPNYILNTKHYERITF